MAHERVFVHLEIPEVFTGYGQLLEAYIGAVQVTSVPGSSDEGLGKPFNVTRLDEAVDDDFIMESPWETFILQSRMQDCLLTMCTDLGVVRPVYKKVHEQVRNQYLFYTYEVTVHYVEEPWVHKFKGRYARTEDFAREDAARVALTWLIPKLGKEVWDLHYTRNQELEKKVAAQKGEIDALNAEINMLQQKLNLLKLVDSDI
ncbi:hypothetical protein SESBI_29276 [Sesbania bispinosa]|nr:hypothetical protein SESBI_29276 [Sesbania bispinosa]